MEYKFMKSSFRLSEIVKSGGLGIGDWGLGIGDWEIGRASCRERV